MTRKVLPKDPVKSAIMTLMVLDTVGIGLGVVLLLFVEPWLIGLGVILVASLAGGGLFIYKLINVSCPDCYAPMRRDARQGLYVCTKCGTEWGLGRGVMTDE